MRKPLPCRVERLEKLRRAVLQPWRAELAALEAAQVAMFPLPIELWSGDRCEAYVAYQSSDTARRLDELRRMAKPAAERAEDAAAVAEIKAMSRDELDAYLAARCADPEKPPSCQS